MKDTPNPLTVSISYDFLGRVVADPALLAAKVDRSRDLSGTQVLSLAWSTRAGTYQLSPHLTVIALKAFAGRFRPLYDLCSIGVVPYILWRRKVRPTEIIVQDFPLLWAAAVARWCVGGEVVLRLTNLPEDLARTRSAFHRLYHRLNELCTIRFPDRYIAINKTTQEYLIHRGASPERIAIRVPDTITIDHALIEEAKKHRGSIREKYGVPAEVPIVVAVGRLEEEKGFEELIDLFASLPMRAKLFIIGEGKLRASLEERAQRKGAQEKIIFTGRLERPMLWRYYADADAFVLLSKSEALGLVFWEAMYMDVPVIGRPIGGIQETIGSDGERGFFWDSSDGAAQFEVKLARAIKKDDDVKVMMQKAKRFVEESLSKKL